MFVATALGRPSVDVSSGANDTCNGAGTCIDPTLPATADARDWRINVDICAGSPDGLSMYIGSGEI